MRIGDPGAERPITRSDDQTSVDLAGVIELGVEGLGSQLQHVLGPR